MIIFVLFVLLLTKRKMRHYKIINNVKWYYRLKPQQQPKVTKGLFSDIPRNLLTNALIVSLSYYDRSNRKTYRLYTNFKSYLEFGIYQLKLPQHERCFYEIILGESSQKPHFDIDISNDFTDGEAVKNNLIDSIIKVLQNKGVEINLGSDLLQFTSHGPKKQSYHILLNNFCHANNVEAKAFYDKVMEHVNPDYAAWIDRAVYSTTQQFRMVGSQKITTNRIKKLNMKWDYHGHEILYKYPERPDSPEHEMVMQLEASVIGYTGSCKFLPPFEPRPDTIKTYEDTDDITIDDAKNAITLIAAAGKISINSSMFPYKFTGINGPIVMLKRTKASMCKICQRIHEHENPYLIVIGEEKSVYFFCRRAPENSKLFLGKLNPTALDNEPGNDPDNNNQTNPIETVKINWTKNVLERVNEIARSNSSDNKKYISPATQIEPKYKEQLIKIYLESK